MMAKIAKPPVPMHIYRRFAVITIMCAAAMAVFADGSNRDALADEFAERERQAELERISAEQTTPGKLTLRDPQNTAPRGAADDESGSFGSPMMRVAASGGSRIRPSGPSGASRTGESLIIPGYSKAYLNSLSEEEYRHLVANLEAAGTFSKDIREQNLADIERFSRQRSGVVVVPEGMVN